MTITDTLNLVDMDNSAQRVAKRLNMTAWAKDFHPRLALMVALKIAYFLSQNLRRTSGELSDLMEGH